MSRYRAGKEDMYSVKEATVRRHPRRPHFDGHYLRNRSTLDIGVLGYISIV